MEPKEREGGRAAHGLTGCALCEMNIAAASNTNAQLKLISLLFLLGAGHSDIGAKGRVSSQ
jgi:hypothetical protein